MLPYERHARSREERKKVKGKSKTSGDAVDLRRRKPSPISSDMKLTDDNDDDENDNDSPTTLSEKDGTLYNKDGTRVGDADLPLDVSKKDRDDKISSEKMKNNPLLTKVITLHPFVRSTIAYINCMHVSGMYLYFMDIFRNFKT